MALQPHRPADTSRPSAEDSEPTWFIDADTPAVRRWADGTAAGCASPREAAVALYRDVRDRIRYDPYLVTGEPEAFKASRVLVSEANWCVPKAVLLVAGARSLAIPARLGFADVRNHLSSDKLRDRMGTDLFVYHGFAELWIDGRWVRATPTFNSELCDRFGVPPLDFDGVNDALFHAYDSEGRRHMEYVRYHPSRSDLPLDEILDALRVHYGGAPADTSAGRDRAFG